MNVTVIVHVDGNNPGMKAPFIDPWQVPPVRVKLPAAVPVKFMEFKVTDPLAQFCTVMVRVLFVPVLKVKLPGFPGQLSTIW